MFSSNNTIYPSPPSSFHHYPPPHFIAGDDIFLHHHHLMGNRLSPENPFRNAASNNPATGTVRPPGKKDRHSKIYTAQGQRDRRVRLSIGIARKFFDLQDLLGFDKASQTLDWLLTKSKMAIKELEYMKQTDKVSDEINDKEMKGKHSGDIFGENVTKASPHKVAIQLIARESRAKARARARERTRVKMCSRRITEDQKIFFDQDSYCFNKLKCSSQLENYKELELDFDIQNVRPSLDLIDGADGVEAMSSRSLANQGPRKEISEESIVFKRRLKASSSFSDHPNLSISKDTSYDNYVTNLPQNWDTSNAIPCSSFFTATVMDSSTEFHFYGKSWEACNGDRGSL